MQGSRASARRNHGDPLRTPNYLEITHHGAISDGEQGRSPDDRGDGGQAEPGNEERRAEAERRGQQTTGRRPDGVACRSGRRRDPERLALAPGMYGATDREVGDGDGDPDEQSCYQAQGPQQGNGVDLGLRQRGDACQ